MNIFDFQCSCGRCPSIEAMPSSKLMQVIHTVELRFGRQATVVAGYRCKLADKDYCTSPHRRRHRTMRAIDITVPTVTNAVLFRFLKQEYPANFLFFRNDDSVHIFISNRRHRGHE